MTTTTILDTDVQVALTAIEKCDVRQSSPIRKIIEIPFGHLPAGNPRTGRRSLLPAIRYVMQSIGLDENRLLKARLEHKLLQNIVLRRYCPDAFPESVGLSQIIVEKGEEELERYLTRQFPLGFCIKSTLGSGSPRGVVDVSNLNLLGKIRSGDLVIAPKSSVLEELWLVQTKLDIDIEYKVHTLESDVIPGLTPRYRHQDLEMNRKRAEMFVSDILRRLPAGLIKDSFCGWDIALTKDQRFAVIEVNYSGMHTVECPGYQCSGFLQDAPKGPANFALLASHVQKTYGVTIKYDFRQDGLDEKQRLFFPKVDLWTKLVQIRELVDSLATETLNAYGVVSMNDLTPLAQDSTDRMYIRNVRNFAQVSEDLMFPSDW